MAARFLREHLEDNRENYTRFFLLSVAAAAVNEVAGAPELASAPDKLSLVFQLAHSPGALLARWSHLRGATSI